MHERDIHGFLLLDKPSGLTSNRALQKAKRLFGARKAGHTGSLDPLATGLLPICFGAATRVAQFVLVSDKTYEVTAVLGARTDTDDADGRIVEQSTLPPLTREGLDRVLQRFLGATLQTPPMYSAVKHQGRRLYELARRGVEVERSARPITIRTLETIAFAPPEFAVRVTCSKGTYVRTLVTDVAAALGTIGHVTALRRVAVDTFAGQRMWSFDALEDLAGQGTDALEAALLATDTVLGHWPEVVLDAAAVERVRHGQRVALGAGSAVGRHRIYSATGEFVGIGEITAVGELAPRRILG